MTGKTTKMITTSNRSRNVKPQRAMGDQPPTTGPTLASTVDRDKVEATTMKSVVKKLRRTKGSSGL